MTVEGSLNDRALHAAPTPVDHADLAQSGVGGSGHILLDDRRDVTRREGMKIELGLEGNVGNIRNATVIVRHARCPACGIRP